MAIIRYPKCHRGRTDCEPIHCIPSEPPGITEEQFMTCDYVPDSFVCSGCVNKDSLMIEQDRYRLCFKNDLCDDMSDNDLQDLTSVITVISAALNLDAVLKVNNGIVEIPAENGLDRSK